MKNKLIGTVILILFCSSSSFATVYFTIRSGNWNNTTTGQTPWASTSCAGAVEVLTTPAAGDTITICNAHTVTIPVGYTATIGASPNDDVSTPAIQEATTSGTGILVVNGTLIFRGTVIPANAAWVVGPGATVTHDSHLAAVPSTTHYSWQVGASGGTNTNSVLNINGTLGSHATFNIAASSGIARGFGNQAGSNNNGGGRIVATYADFSDWGGFDGATNFAFDEARFNAAQTLSLSNSTCTRCGAIDFINPISATAVITLTNWSTYASADQNQDDFYAQSDTTAMTSGTRSITNSFMVGSFKVAGTNSGQWTFSNSIFGGLTTSSDQTGFSFACTTSTTGTNTITDVLLFNNINASSSPADIPCLGTFTRFWALRQSTTNNINAHFVESKTCAAGDTVVNSAMFELSPLVILGGGGGDFWQPIGVAACVANRNWTFNNILAVPSSGDSIRPGTIVNMSAPAGLSPKKLISISKVTYPDDGINLQGGVCYWENIAQMDSMYTVCQNSIIWSNASHDLRFSNCTTCGTLVNFAVHGADFNWAYNNSGSIYTPTTISYASPTVPGGNDKSGNPGFVDTTRSFLKWCQTIDSSLTTWVACIAKMDPQSAGYNSRFNIADGYNWVRQGFAPTNIVTATAASDGTYVGAVPPITISARVLAAQ